MLEYIEQDLFEGVETLGDKVVIAHVCNNQGVMGAGFVVPLAKKYPNVKKEYLKWANVEGGNFYLGEVQYVHADNELYVANMVAQTLDGERPLYYNHLVKCMENVARFAHSDLITTTIVAPLFGAGLAGGKWEFVEELIKDIWVDNCLDVKIFYLKQFLPHGLDASQFKNYPIIANDEGYYYKNGF